MSESLIQFDVGSAVRDRYSEAAQERESQLCCPVSYDPRFLTVIPAEVLERDYGCGDPSKYVLPGDVVLDLGSGGGKICFIASQVVGPTGLVIGVDCNDEMLALARRSQPQVARAIGFDNVQFHKGQIQDLRLDLDRFDRLLKEDPISTSSDWLRMAGRADELRRTSPLVANDSIDVVVSNCVLNLVHTEDRRQLFDELFRVVKPGGRAVISDIVANRDVPVEMRSNAELWSGCISGAYREDQFLTAFETAGFGGLEIVERSAAPWRVVEGIEFRSMTVRAYKLPGDFRSGWDGSNATDVVYRGPWKSVEDDRGNRFDRGQRTGIGPQTADVLRQSPYAKEMIFVSGVPTDLTLPISSNCCGDSGCC